LTAGEFLDDVTEEARHGDRRRVDGQISAPVQAG
jgi:hypothetical protein